jgi:hypothetical protein
LEQQLIVSLIVLETINDIQLQFIVMRSILL